MARVLGLLYGIVSYAVFFVTILYSIAFIGNLSVHYGDVHLTPRTIDGSGEDAPFGVVALLLNLLLLSVFWLQHSVMARPAFKKVWTKIVPKAVERSTYVLLSSGALILMIAYWQPITFPIWQTDGVLAIALSVVFWAGWLIVLASTMMINHLELCGLKQVWDNLKQKEASGNITFVSSGFYKVCRHPIMLGFIIAFWAAPTMTLGHSVFALTTTIYILVALVLEEKDLLTQLGDTYARYQQSVSKLIPLPGVLRENGVTSALIEDAAVEEELKEASEA